MGDAPADDRGLTAVQRWFHAVVTHPEGVAAGVASPAAQALARLDREALESMVRRSSRLSAEQRLSIYANAYYARLIECMGDCYPLLKRVLGAELFDGFAFDYLQRHPSRSYTLDRLAESFPRFLEETRPDRAPTPGDAGASADPVTSGATGDSSTPGSDASDTPGAPGIPDAPGRQPAAWPDFLIDLATLELAIAKVFDGPGCEGEPLLSFGDLPSADRFAACRLAPVPCLHLLRFRYPVNAFYSAARALGGTTDEIPGPHAATEAAPHGAGAALAAEPPYVKAAAQAERSALHPETDGTDETDETIETAETAAGDPSLPPFPDPADEYLALSRTDFVVQRHALSPLEHAILAALLAGAPVGDANAAGVESAQGFDGAGGDDDDLAAQVGSAFRRFTAAGFFRAVIS